MNWDESKHPRDEDGKFAFKGGDGQKESKEKNLKEKKNQEIKPFKLGVEFNDFKKTQTPAEILLGNSKTAKEKQIQKERSELIKSLGDKLTPAQVLYSSFDELKKIARKSGDIALQKGTELVIGNRHNKVFNNFIKLGVGKETAGMLDIAHGDKMTDKGYLKDSIELKNYNDSFVESDRQYLKNKIEKQFEDYDYDAKNIKGYYFKNTSEPSKRISQNEDFKNLLRENKGAILKNENFSARFKKHGEHGILNDNDLKNAIGAFDVRNVRFDKEGNLHLKIYDTYDFNKNAPDFLNKAGRHEMEAGYLKPYFSIHDIIINKNEINDILKEWKVKGYFSP